MANYTIELGTLLDNCGYDWGMNSYPVPDYMSNTPDAFRAQLNEMIKTNYYFNEICDVPDRFKVFINSWMITNMPYYCLQLQAIHDNRDYTQFSNYIEDVTSNGNGSTTGSTTSTSDNTDNRNGSSYNLNVESSTPAQMLNIEDDIANNTYASSANKSKGTESSSDTFKGVSTGSSSGTSKNSSALHRTIKGSPSVSKAELYKIYTTSIKNVYNTIIKQLSIFFMEVY